MHWSYVFLALAHRYGAVVTEQTTEAFDLQLIRSSDNDSTGFWPPGSLHTLGANGHI